MRKLIFFMVTTLNGYFERGKWDVEWHNADDEFDVFAAEQLDEADTLLFGRVTYEGMASYWHTPEGIAEDPVVAGQMNGLRKIVFSRTLEQADWGNTRLVKDNIAEVIARLKEEPAEDGKEGKDLLLLASSDLAVSLAELGLIDEYRVMVNPILLAGGTPLFTGLRQDLELELLRARTFKSRNVLLCYAPKKQP